MIEWIVGRVDTGVKKKLLMGAIVYVKVGGQETKTFICNKPNQGDPRGKQQESPRIMSRLNWNPIPNSVFIFS